MAEKQKPDPSVVQVAARILKNPRTATIVDAQRMAARILDDQKERPSAASPEPDSVCDAQGAVIASLETIAGSGMTMIPLPWHCSP